MIRGKLFIPLLIGLALVGTPDDADAAWLPLRGARGPVLAICDLRELERLAIELERVKEQAAIHKEVGW